MNAVVPSSSIIVVFCGEADAMRCDCFCGYSLYVLPVPVFQYIKEVVVVYVPVCVMLRRAVYSTLLSRETL